MRNSARIRNVFIIYLLCLLSMPLMAFTAGASDSPVRVAVLPFAMHTPSDLAYLQDGIRDMLASRLAWQGKVNVVDRAVTEQALKGARPDITLADAQKIGRSLNADYVLFGSVTALGQSISIDAKMVPLDGNSEPTALYAQTNSLDEVVPKINEFAQTVNRKVFARSDDPAMASSEDSETLATRNPELLLPDSMVKRDRISYLNPNFVEINPEGSLQKAGLWRSQTFQGGIVGMDVGDLNGNGRKEMVTVGENKLMVHRREAHGLKVVATYNGNKMDRFLWVALADADQDGKDEIYVTNLRRRNYPTDKAVDSISQGRDERWELASFGLVLDNAGLRTTCEGLPYFLNAVQLSGRKKTLLGQQKGHDEAFKPGIHEMYPKGKSLVPGAAVSLPGRCNVFNFAKADINGDHAQEIIVIDTDNRLFVMDSAGNTLWKSRHRFAATTNSFIGKVEDLRFNRVDYYSIPSPIAITDLNKDNILEVVVNRSPDYSRFLPEGFKYIESGEIVSLSWDQLGLVENWKTREIGGMVTSIRIADLDSNGTPELLASYVMAKDFLKLWESKSAIFSYDLNVASNKTAKLP